MMEYNEEDYLMLSGIQHFSFCRRQWALIHVEQQWADNVRTFEGEVMHKNAHDGNFSEKRNDLFITRNLPIHSKSLGLSGNCDVVEFRTADDGVELYGRKGRYKPYPVEYKRGEPKEHDADILQLTAQAMCLEEMLCCEIQEGALYYGETRHRLVVEFSQEIRERVEQMCLEMHKYYNSRYTPKVKWSKSCNACSLSEICMPKLGKCKDVNKYISSRIMEDDE
jgi:CRISPR-associated exonuclease Cas4